MTPSFSERARNIVNSFPTCHGNRRLEVVIEQALREAAAQAWEEAAECLDNAAMDADDAGDQDRFGLSTARDTVKAKAAAIRGGNTASGGEGE